MLVAGIAYLVNAPRPNSAATRIQVTASAAYLPGADAPSGLMGRAATTTTTSPPLVAEAISLAALAEAAKAAARPSTTRPPVTTTTVKKAAVTTTSTTERGIVPPTTSTTAKPFATTVTTTPLTALTTILQQVAPAAVTYAHSENGVASWFGAPSGTCAHRTLPMGTILKVTRLYNGATVTCKVDDRGPSDTSRLIDLSKDSFQKLASIDAGLIDVKVEW
jgi:rare lipoprotein A